MLSKLTFPLKAVNSIPEAWDIISFIDAKRKHTVDARCSKPFKMLQILGGFEATLPRPDWIYLEALPFLL